MRFDGSTGGGPYTFAGPGFGAVCVGVGDGPGDALGLRRFGSTGGGPYTSAPGRGGSTSAADEDAPVAVDVDVDVVVDVVVVDGVVAAPVEVEVEVEVFVGWVGPVLPLLAGSEEHAASPTVAASVTIATKLEPPVPQCGHEGS